jgi:hypothetical protein
MEGVPAPFPWVLVRISASGSQMLSRSRGGCLYNGQNANPGPACMLRTLPAQARVGTRTSHVPTALARAWIVILLAAVSAPGQVNVATGQYDVGRSGSNPAEIVLNTSNINSSQFGLLFSLPVDGFIFAQPLYLSGVTIQGTTRNVVYVATMNNSVYAFDADNPSVGAPLWQVNLGPPSTDTVGSVAFQTTLGILSTPVIDPFGGIIYVVAATLQNGTQMYQLHALSITTGQDQLGGPVTIQASVPGSAPDSVNGQLAFNPAIQWQRPSLLLNNGSLYLGFGAGVAETQTAVWHGWFLQYNASNLQLMQAYCTTPDGNGGGVWMSGGGPAADDTGVYYAIGNGSFDMSGDTGESVIWLGPSSTSSFTTYDYATLNADDLDLGATATLLLPNTNLLVVGGKDGELYVLNRNNLGGEQTGNTQIAQYFLGTTGCMAGMNPGSTTCAGVHNLATWGGTNLYVWGGQDVLRGYSLTNNGTFNTTPFATGTLPALWRGGVLAVSSDGQQAGTGVLWATMANENASLGVLPPGTLYAFDASSLAQLWNSGMNAADTLGNMAKFSMPTVANGKVYVPTFSDQLNVYGIHTLSSSSLSFGDQTTGTVSAAQQVTFTNGTPTPLATPTITPSGDFAATSTCLGTMAPGAACVISVTFTPTAAGTRSGAVTINDSLISSPQTIALTGYGLMPQTITFGSLSNQPYGAAPFAVSAAASSGLTVSFNSQTSSVCSVSGTTVTLLSAGQCTVQATQPGDGMTYAAATPVSESFQVTPTAPTVVSLSPASGTGLTQTFSMVFSDPNGISDLKNVLVVFNTSVSLASDCAVVYTPATNKMYLYDNAGTASKAGIIPGSSASVANSQCTLAGTGSSFSTSGNDLTLNVALTFAGTFVGQQNVYQYATGTTANSGWAKKGTWMPASAGPPTVVSLSPASGSGLTQTFSMVYSDPNGISDLKNVLVVYNTSVSLAGDCTVVYTPATNKMYLYDNAGTALSAGITPGSSASASNSQCTLAGTGSSFSTSGDDLTLQIALTFTGTFAGRQNVYLYATGTTANSGWAKKGTWTP